MSHYRQDRPRYDASYAESRSGRHGYSSSSRAAVRDYHNPDTHERPDGTFRRDHGYRGGLEDGLRDMGGVDRLAEHLDRFTLSREPERSDSSGREVARRGEDRLSRRDRAEDTQREDESPELANITESVMRSTRTSPPANTNPIELIQTAACSASAPRTMPATEIIPVGNIHRPLRIIRTVKERLASDQAAQERLMAGTHASRSSRTTTRTSLDFSHVDRSVDIRTALMALRTLPGMSSLDQDLLTLFVSTSMSAVAEWADIIVEPALLCIELFINVILNASISKSTRMRAGFASWKTKRRIAVVGVILASIPKVIDQRVQISVIATTGSKTTGWKSMCMSRFRRTGVPFMDLTHGNAGKEMSRLLEDAACTHALGKEGAYHQRTF